MLPKAGDARVGLWVLRLWGSQRCSVTWQGYIPRWQLTVTTLTTVPGVIRYKGAKIQVVRPGPGLEEVRFFHSLKRTYLELSVCQETFCMLIFDLPRTSLASRRQKTSA